MIDKLSDAAKELGREHGLAKGRFIHVGNCTKDAAQKILDGYNDGIEPVMALCPEPLSGEWADDPTPMAILEQIYEKIDKPMSMRGEEMIEDNSNILDTYEEAFREAFWGAVTTTCKYILEDHG